MCETSIISGSIPLSQLCEHATYLPALEASGWLLRGKQNAGHLDDSSKAVVFFGHQGG